MTLFDFHKNNQVFRTKIITQCIKNDNLLLYKNRSLFF